MNAEPAVLGRDASRYVTRFEKFRLPDLERSVALAVVDQIRLGRRQQPHGCGGRRPVRRHYRWSLDRESRRRKRTSRPIEQTRRHCVVPRDREPVASASSSVDSRCGIARCLNSVNMRASVSGVTLEAYWGRAMPGLSSHDSSSCPRNNGMVRPSAGVVDIQPSTICRNVARSRASPTHSAVRPLVALLIGLSSLLKGTWNRQRLAARSAPRSARSPRIALTRLQHGDRLLPRRPAYICRSTPVAPTATF